MTGHLSRLRSAAATESGLVVGLVGGSHLVNHAYLVLLPPVIATLADEFGVSIAAIGLAIGVQGAVNAALQLPFGHLADARSRTLVLGISLSFGALGAALTALATSFEWLLVSQVVLGVGIAGHHPAHYPLLAAATDPAHRGRAYSVHGFMGSLGFAVPPAAVAGVVALGGSWREAVLLVAAGGALYGLVALWLLRTRVAAPVRRPEGAGERPLVPADLRGLPRRVAGDLWTVVTAPAMLTLTLLALVASAAGWGIRTYTVVLLTDAYGLGEGPANAVVAAMFVTGAACILAGGVLADRHGGTPVLLGGFGALVVLGVALASGAVPALAAGALVLVLSGTVSVSRPARSTLADALSGRADLGKSFALVTVGITAGGAVAPPVLGAVLVRYGVGAVFLAVAGLAVLAVALTLRLRGAAATADLTTVAADD